MTKRLLLEGPEIEQLLAQVRQDYGEGARIVSADRVRSGGVAGFFARQRYELTVEVDEDDPALPAPFSGKDHSMERQNPDSATRGLNSGPPRRPGTVEDLIALADARDSGETGQARRIGPGGGLTPEAEAGMRAAAAEAERQAMRPDATRPDATRADAARADASLPEAPLMRSLPPQSLRPGPALPEQEEGPDAAAFTPAAAFDQVLAALRRDGTAPPGPGEPPGPPPDEASARGEGEERDLSESPERRIQDEALAFEQPSSPPPPPETEAPEAETAARVAAAPPAPPAPPVSATSPAARRAVGYTAVHAAGDERLRSQLLDLGVPESLVAGVSGADPYTAIVNAFGSLPPAPWPPSRPGDVLVIAGPLENGLDVATRVARAERLNQHDILLAASSTAGTGVHPSRRISGPADALRRARRMHRADTAQLVVVATSAAEDDNGDWVRSVCDALGASAVWAVVDATRKTADTRAHLDSLGPVHALAVHGAHVTADPGTVLRLDLPIVYLDGRRVTPAVWAALLCERLEGRTT